MATSSSQSAATIRGSMWPRSAMASNLGHSFFSSAVSDVSRYTGSGAAPPSSSAVVGLIVVPLRALYVRNCAPLACTMGWKLSGPLRIPDVQ
ncbi:hypothetical protein VDGD_20573 [Verticillium dahliae]|nr:hypothetical protein VDGD_20573 [Verticillium dahliae]